MVRITPRLFALILLALMPGLPVQAQEGGDLPEAQQAILTQLRDAIAATQEFESFVTTASGTTTTDQILLVGDSEMASDQIIQLDRVTHFTHDVEGAANAQSTFEIEITAKGFDQEAPVTTTIQAEARLVAGAVYVRAEGESTAGTPPPLLPEGWVQLTDPDEWPALSVLGLDRILANPTDPDLFDPLFYALLDHASEVWSDASDGGDPQQIGVRVAGEGLVNALISVGNASGATNEAAAVLYNGMTEGTWEITVELDGAGQIARIRTEGFMQWLDFDLTLLQPTAPAGSLFTQFYLNESEVVLSEVNVPLAPVEAPALEAG